MPSYAQGRVVWVGVIFVSGSYLLLSAWRSLLAYSTAEACLSLGIVWLELLVCWMALTCIGPSDSESQTQQPQHLQLQQHQHHPIPMWPRKPDSVDDDDDDDSGSDTGELKRPAGDTDGADTMWPRSTGTGACAHGPSHSWLYSKLPRACLYLLSASLVLLTLCALTLSVVPLHDDALDPQLELCLWTVSMAEAEELCLTRPHSDLVVSLTTLPRRMPYIHRTLKTLLMGSYCPSAIFVWIPRRNARENAAYALPPSLLLLNRTSTIVRFMLLDEDYGPATKLIPALQHFQLVDPRPHQGIVVLDDDVLYARDLLQRYACYSQLLPGAALTAWGCLLPPAGQPQGEGSCVHGRELQYPLPAHLMFGTASFFVTPNMLGDLKEVEAFARAPQDARFEDDL